MSTATLTRVEPAHLWVPDHVTSAGDEVVDFAQSAGMTLDLDQRMLLELMYAEDKHGSLVCREFCIICARQNLKTYCLIAAQLADAWLFKKPLSVWTAHLFDTAQDAFRDINALIDGSDELSRHVLNVRTGNGAEAVELKSGARIRFKARNKSGGRGLTSDRCTLDEGFALQTVMMGALIPTMSAREDAQVRYGSSAGLADSDVLRGVRDRGRKGDDPKLGYVEWCAEPDTCAAGKKCTHELGLAGCALDDKEKVRQANPQLDGRLKWENIQTERRVLATDPEEYARERLGWWSDPGVIDPPYPLDKWRELADVGSTREGRPQFALDINPSRTRASIGYCAKSTDDFRHLELGDYRPGTGWIEERAAEILKVFPESQWGIVKDGQAATEIEKLEQLGIDVVEFDTSKFAGACAELLDAIEQSQCRHIDQAEVTAAMKGAKKRELEGKWTLARKGLDDISPLVSFVVSHQLFLDNDDDGFNVW